MNKKTFTVALLFLIGTLAWLGVNIYWVWIGHCRIFGLFIPLLCVLAGVAMVLNEVNKKKLKHLEEVNKHKIP